MPEAVQFDLKQLLISTSSFGPSEIQQIIQLINQDYLQFGVLREAVQELESNEDRSPAMAAKLGVCYYLLGKYRLASETLANADGGALALFYLGKSQAALDRHDEALGQHLPVSCPAALFSPWKQVNTVHVLLLVCSPHGQAACNGQRRDIFAEALLVDFGSNPCGCKGIQYRGGNLDTLLDDLFNVTDVGTAAGYHQLVDLVVGAGGVEELQ